ncbi:MAG: mechanosensitive ion channel family protein [Betaproteobacteria bacterium]|nr:mechanosensitive ion channel family protein [Betaproteobacteria bacterium]
MDLNLEKSLQWILAWFSANASHAARIALVLVVALLLLRAIRVLVPRIREHLASRQESIEDAKRIQTLMRVAHYLLSLSTLGVATLLVMGEIGISLAPILGAAGIVGIAVGFGAQTLVKDYVGGLLLLVENQIRVGDMIEVSGKTGIVEEVSLRFIRLRDYGGNVHFIPNGTITVITNSSLGFAYAVLDISITYGSDIDTAMNIMRKVDEDLRADPEHAPRILGALEIAGVDQWADSSLVIRGRIQVKPLEQWNVRREYLKRLKAAFDAGGLEIPLPRMKLVQ